MKPLPMPIRLAAGLVATALEEAQRLPQKITELPMTAVSRALQASMRLQQRVTELAIKGDRALNSLRPVPETPTWARFDEDEEPGLGGSNGLAPLSGSLAGSVPPKVTPVRILRDPEPDYDDDLDFDPNPPADEVEPSEVPAPRVPADPSAVKPARVVVEPEPPNAQPATPAKSEPTKAKPDSATAEGGPPGLSGYEGWSLPQLRGRLRNLSLAQLERLLAWETSHQDRPPYLTMLSNRITSVREK